MGQERVKVSMVRSLVVRANLSHKNSLKAEGILFKMMDFNSHGVLPDGKLCNKLSALGRGQVLTMQFSHAEAICK
jgi:hypothetical protein